MIRALRLPGIDKALSSVLFGTWGLGGPNEVGGVSCGWPELGRAAALDIVAAALDAGIDVIDTSDFYGGGFSEEIIGECLSGRRDQAVIATKGGLLPRLVPGTSSIDRSFSVEHLTKALEGSLRRLRTDYIDLYQLHGPPADALNRDELWRLLEHFKTSGKVRAIGISMRRSDAKNPDSPWWDCAAIDSVQLPYSPAAAQSVGALRQAKERVGMRQMLLGRSILHHGLLLRPAGPDEFVSSDHRAKKTSDRLVAELERFWSLTDIGADLDDRLAALLAFALGSREVDGVVVGASRPSQIAALAEATRDPRVNDKDLSKRLHAAAQAVWGSNAA